MNDWAKENPVMYSLIIFALGIMITIFFSKVYIDYKDQKKYDKFETQLNRIENGQETIHNIIKQNLKELKEMSDERTN